MAKIVKKIQQRNRRIKHLYDLSKINVSALLGSNRNHRRQLSAVVHGWGAYGSLALFLLRLINGQLRKQEAGEKKSNTDLAPGFYSQIAIFKTE